MLDHNKKKNSCLEIFKTFVAQIESYCRYILLYFVPGTQLIYYFKFWSSIRIHIVI